MSHYNSVQKSTDINLDTATLDSPSGEDHGVPSQSSRLIPEYANFRISGLRQSKIIKEKYKKGNGTPKIFGLITLFTYMAMYYVKYILSEIASFADKLILHEERAKSSPDNLPNLTNHLAYNIEAGDDTFNFKEATSQPNRMDFVETIIGRK